MPKSNSIAVILKGYPRLSETFIAQEILALQQAGLKIEIVSLRHPTDDRKHPINAQIEAPVNYLPEYIRDEGCRVLKSFGKVIARPKFWQALKLLAGDYWRDRTANRLRRFGQAVVLAAELPLHTRWIYAHFIHTPGSVARYAATIRGLPFSLSAHAKDIWTIPEWEIREKLCAARWTVCCTKAYRQRLSEVSPTAEVALLYHGVDLKRYPPPQDRKHHSGRFHIVCVARAVEKKGLDTLVAALERLPEGLDWQFTHVGGGPDLDKLKTMASNAKLNGRIDWLGPRDHSDVMEVLGQGDLFCLPARLGSDGDRDGLPNVLMEAFSQALPVVTTDVGGIGELVDDSCGIIVPSSDPKALSQALTELARDPDRRRSMGRAGYARLAQHFGFQDNVQPLIDKLRQAVEP